MRKFILHWLGLDESIAQLQEADARNCRRTEVIDYFLFKQCTRVQSLQKRKFVWRNHAN